jgi:hypothetical protein
MAQRIFIDTGAFLALEDEGGIQAEQTMNFQILALR